MNTIACVAVDPDCTECQQLRGKRRDRQPDHECDDLCNMVARMLIDPEGHKALHAAEHCRTCGARKYEEDGYPVQITRRCKHGWCREFCCVNCGEVFGGDGPVACPCSTSWWTRFWLRLTGYGDAVRLPRRRP